MPTTITTKADQNGTMKFVVSFTDEDGNAVTPNVGLTWSLKDTDGNVINNRSSEALTPASSVTIILTGDDLAVQTAEEGVNTVLRQLWVVGTYDSDAGSDLPLSDFAVFLIENSD